MKPRLAALVFLLWIAGTTGCRNSKLHGTVEGNDFGKVQSAFFLTDSSSLEETLLVLTNYPEGCLTYNGYFKQGSTPSEPLPLNALFIRFQLTEPVAAQQYEIVATNEVYEDWITWVHAWFRTYSEEDGWTGPDAIDGAIDVTTVDDGLMSGTIEVTLDNGDTLEGKFFADHCDGAL